MPTERTSLDTNADREALARLDGEADLRTLETYIGGFNIFDALGLARAEIRHSNFLAFILDPAESHGLGPLFLKPLLIDLFKTAPEPLRSRLPAEMDAIDLQGVEVQREWEDIDLLIVCREPPFAVAIENKVDSHEHSDQLNRYQKVVQARYPDLPALYVYLTPDGDKPSEDSWEPYTYERIHRVLKRIRDSNPTTIGAEVLVFLNHYLNLVGTRFMKDERLDELCQRIYKNHRQALDLIWARVRVLKSAFFSEVMDDLKNDDRWYVFLDKHDYIQFVPRTWIGWLPPLGDYDNDKPQYWISGQLDANKGEVNFNVFIASMIDKDLQSTIITKLRKEGPGCGFKSSRSQKVDAWHWIFAKERVSEWAKDEEPETAVIRADVKQKLDELYPKFEKLAAVLKPLCVPSTLLDHT